MKIVFLSNTFYHLQKPIADELYKLTNGEYRFIETKRMSDYQKKLGFSEVTTPYVIQYNAANKDEIDQMIMDAEVVQYGEAPLSLIRNRIKAGKLTFRDDERRYKAVNRYLKWPIYTYNSLTLNKCYLLCASAFGARDYSYSGMKLSKCYKWGYFSEVRVYDDIESLIINKDSQSQNCFKRVSILWAGRLVKLKHPESAIIIAKKLKKIGYDFVLNIIGIGPLEAKLKRMVKSEGLKDKVNILGSMSPDEVRTYMEKADIYIFTSDQGEGWGAVLNESMNSACAVVASSKIGAVPYMINDGINGLLFKDQDWNHLFVKVRSLIDNIEERTQLGKQAYFTVLNTWNPQTAASNFLALIGALQNNEDSPIQYGPCSKAIYLRNNWYKG